MLPVGEVGVEVTAIYIIPGVSTRPEWISQLIGMTFSISTPISQAKMSQVGKFLSPNEVHFLLNECSSKHTTSLYLFLPVRM